jgi:hypothetical protein
MVIGGESSKLLLVPRPEEKMDHLAMKLAGFVMFMPMRPIVDPASDHPSLTWLDVKPDVMALTDAGDIRLWLECGEVSINKIDKVARRLPQTRVVVIKAQMHQARQLRERLNDEVRQGGRVEIWTWPPGEFANWMSAMAEKVEIFGDADEKSFNLVVNSVPYAVDLVSV